MSRTFVYRLLISLAAAAGGSSPLRAQPIYWDSLESPLPSWKLYSSDAPHRIVRHQRIRDVVHSGDWAEAVSIAARRGSQIYLALDFGQAQVIDELQLGLWLRADRPGMQIAAQVVLPRVADPRSGEPLTVLVYGNLYRDVGTWQRLFLDNLPKRVADQVRILRSGGTGSIDAKEAYVDRLLINAYGGVGTTNVWIDDVEIVGLVGSGAEKRPAGVALAGYTGSSPAAGAAGAANVQMRGAVLWTDGVPFFPRIIQYQGEPPSWLRQLGFNTLQLDSPPTGDLQAEAARLGLWLICPPPQEGAAANMPTNFERVLAWHVGSQLTRHDLPATIQEVRRLRSADRALRRPILCGSQTELRAFSRHADALLADRDSIGSSLELTDYASWLRHIQLLARPATPIWVRIQSDFAPAWQRQLAALANQPIAPAEVCYSVLRQQVFLAITQGARGLYFTSRGPLNTDNPPARRRAMALELINLELQLLETWAAAGRVAAPASSNQPAITAALLQSERGRLLLPLRTAGGSQYVTTAAPREGVKFIVPGIPPSNRAYLVTLAGLKPLQRRVTGGNHISLESPDSVTAVLITEDPVVVDRLSQTIQRIRRRASELKCGLAAEEFSAVDDVEHRLAAETGANDSADALEPARQLVKQCQSALAAGDANSGLLHSCGALSELDRVRRRSWNTAIRQLGHPSQLPLLATHGGLPLAYKRSKALRGARWGENQLKGGDMEDLGGMLAAGWRHVRLIDDSMASQVELSATRPHSGRRSLHLHVQRGGELAPEFVEAPPLWIVSPSVPLSAGQIVRIEGWAWVPDPVTATADGLLIFDSVAGPSMAKRIGQTSGWQKFTLYRAASTNGPMSVTIALAGIGDAWVDDVSLRAVSATAQGGELLRRGNDE